MEFYGMDKGPYQKKNATYKEKINLKIFEKKSIASRFRIFFIEENGNPGKNYRDKTLILKTQFKYNKKYKKYNPLKFFHTFRHY